MIDIKSLFKPKDSKEIAQAEKDIALTAMIAKKCLEYDDFKLYKASYERTEAATINSLLTFTKEFIETPGGDINKYALTTMRLLTKLESLRYLVRTIENNSKKAESNNETQINKD